MNIALRGKQRQALLGGYMIKGAKKSIGKVSGFSGVNDCVSSALVGASAGWRLVAIWLGR